MYQVLDNEAWSRKKGRLKRESSISSVLCVVVCGHVSRAEISTNISEAINYSSLLTKDEGLRRDIQTFQVALSQLGTARINSQKLS